MRRGDYVYMFVSGSLFDSAYYTVFFVAAKTVEELATDNPNRLVGRYLIPSKDQSFGHGTPSSARTARRSTYSFEDRGDGKGDIWIKPRFPAEG